MRATHTVGEDPQAVRTATVPAAPPVAASRAAVVEANERAVLGACLQSRLALTRAATVLTGADFADPRHELIWEAITRITQSGTPVDPAMPDAILVVADLLERGELGTAGGGVYVAGLVGPDVTTSNVGYYARIVRASADDRRLIALGTRLAERAATPGSATERATLIAATRQVLDTVEASVASTASSALPAVVSLTELLAVPDDAEPAWRIHDLWPAGGKVELAAQWKTGKTTLAANVVRALVDGAAFLDRFPVQRANRVTLIDDELAPRMLREWLRDQQIASTDAVQVVSLRGRASTFNLLDAGVRAAWARQLVGTEVLVIDCLRPILDALRLDERSQAGIFLQALDELATAAGVSEILLVHHMGHSGEHARGDSRLLDWPDAVWNMLRGSGSPDEAPRFFSAFGRDVAVPESALAYDPTTRALTLTDDGSRAVVQRQSRVAELVPHVVQIVGDRPGINASEVGRALRSAGVRFTKGEENRALREAVAAGLLQPPTKKGTNANSYVVKEVPLTPPNSPAGQPGGTSQAPPTPLYGVGGTGELPEARQGHALRLGLIPTQRQDVESGAHSTIDAVFADGAA